MANIITCPSGLQGAAFAAGRHARSASWPTASPPRATGCSACWEEPPDARPYPLGEGRKLDLETVDSALKAKPPQKHIASQFEKVLEARQQKADPRSPCRGGLSKVGDRVETTLGGVALSDAS